MEDSQKIDKFFAARRAVVLSRFLFERLFQNLLQHLGGVVVVERHVGDHVVVVQLRQFLVHQNCFAASYTPNIFFDTVLTKKLKY